MMPTRRIGRMLPVVLLGLLPCAALCQTISVLWAASGRGLGIVSLVAAEFPGSLWWGDPESFLRSELDGYVTI